LAHARHLRRCCKARCVLPLRIKQLRAWSRLVLLVRVRGDGVLPPPYPQPSGPPKHNPSPEFYSKPLLHVHILRHRSTCHLARNLHRDRSTVRPAWRQNAQMPSAASSRWGLVFRRRSSTTRLQPFQRRGWSRNGTSPRCGQFCGPVISNMSINASNALWSSSAVGSSGKLSQASQAMPVKLPSSSNADCFALPFQLHASLEESRSFLELGARGQANPASFPNAPWPVQRALCMSKRSSARASIAQRQSLSLVS